MELNFKLEESDFLEYQLYASNKSKKQTRNRLRARLIFSLTNLLLAILIYFRTNHVIFSLFVGALGVLWFLFYPQYSRWRYTNHFKGHIKENYKESIGVSVSLIIEESLLYVKDSMTESKLLGENLKKLIELPNHYFVKLGTGTALILPKRVFSEHEKFRQKILDFGAEYINELNWKFT